MAWKTGSKGARRPLRAAVAASAMALVVVACDAPPPDGRDLGIVASAASESLAVGETVTVDVSVTNHGTTAAAGSVLAYLVDEGLTLVEVIGLDSGACDPDTTLESGVLFGRCDLGDLAVGAVVDVDLVVSGEVAGSTAGVLVMAGSDGSEPSDDLENPNSATVSLSVSEAIDPGPVLVGPGRNHLGIGFLGGVHAEDFNLAVNTYCTERAQGDRYQSGFLAAGCSTSPNPEYVPSGYEYYIDIPEGRTLPVEIRLFDARYNPAALAAPGQEPGIDLDLGGTGDALFRFKLYGADQTPGDDSDNPLVAGCSQDFASNAAFDGYSFLGLTRWNTLCTISPAAPSGRYILRVTNGAEPSARRGANAFGIVALSLGGDLCDANSSPTCARVSGKGRASGLVLGNSTSSEVALAEVPAVAEGSTLHLELFDPGEGVQGVQILRPTGPNSWTPATFNWSAPGVGSGGGVTSLSTDGGTPRFNDKVVTISVDLDGYDPPETNQVWKIRYQAGPVTVTDRTTWDVSIVE